MDYNYGSGISQIGCVCRGNIVVRMCVTVGNGVAGRDNYGKNIRLKMENSEKYA